jgi:Uri superfamily endonuclease
MQILKSCPGTYALVLRCRRKDKLQIGRLGVMTLRAGFYVYVGSACGAGGVRARVAYHLRTTVKPHWHIDYLKPRLEIAAIWCCYSRNSQEHAWARRLSELDGAVMPMSGFGASDCCCPAHLYFFAGRPPDRTVFARRKEAKNGAGVSEDLRLFPHLIFTDLALAVARTRLVAEKRRVSGAQTAGEVWPLACKNS